MAEWLQGPGGVWQRMEPGDTLIHKSLGGQTIGTREVQAITDLGMTEAGMIGEPFSPGPPLRPFDGYSGTPRSHDYRTGQNISTRPRINEQVSFNTLRGLLNSYDVASMCVWHRIDSIRSLDWNLVPKKGVTGGGGGAVEYGMNIMRKPDRESSFKTWLAKYLYDVLGYDAGALYRMRNNAGQAIGLRVLDGTTIAPLIDYYGNRPAEPAPAFVQFAQGVPWEWLGNSDLIYEPFRPQSNSMYGKAPLETILLNANTDLRFQAFFLQHFTEGNVPEGFAEAPAGTTPDQLTELQEWWDALLYGDDTQKHKIKWVPPGSNFTWSNESKFDDQFSLFLMRKTAAAYHITPSSLGFTETVNKSSGESQADVESRVGDLPLAEHCQEIFSRFLQDDLHLPLDFEFETGRTEEDLLAVAQADQIYIDSAVVSSSYIAELRFGIVDEEPVPRFVNNTRSGPIPLSELFAVAGPVDQETAAPDPGAALPHHPASPMEGVMPAKPPDQPPLAVREYPAENAASVAAETVADAAPVLKAETAGITAETGLTGNPLLRDEGEGPDDETDHPSAVAKAAEDKAFRTFLRARKRDHKWRDFEFHAATAREAREANRFGQVQTRKGTAGEPSVAGLCVLAIDTGRVLMLQRGLDPTDPASGKWEFPGGHLEDGEDPLTAAVREWCEETGCVPPLTGSIISQWTSANFVYQGIVLAVPHESDVAINPDTPFTSNPDDPDGDLVETCAWWDPADLENNPAVRAELAEDLNLVLAALGPEPSTDEEVVKAQSAWSQHPFRKIEEPLIEHHAGPIGEGLRAMVTKEQIRSAVAAYLAKGE